MARVNNSEAFLMFPSIHHPGRIQSLSIDLNYGPGAVFYELYQVIREPKLSGSFDRDVYCVVVLRPADHVCDAG
jgi:hypothetical protein